jgi:hypothetical protein
LYGGAKMGLFRDISLDGLTRQLIRATACLSSHLQELVFQLGAELNDHILRLEALGAGVKLFETTNLTPPTFSDP